MGTYVNPGNEGFRTVLQSEYVDKTALISEFDRTLDSSDKLVLVSRPRRFGKSYAAKAHVAAVDDYARIEELPSGRGFADVAYLPKRSSQMPALLVELKWNKPADAAIGQIHEKNYPEALRGLGVPLLLVGVTYDAKTKDHACRIEALGVQ